MNRTYGIPRSNSAEFIHIHLYTVKALPCTVYSTRQQETKMISSKAHGLCPPQSPCRVASSRELYIGFNAQVAVEFNFLA